MRKATLEEKAFGALDDNTVRAVDDAVRFVSVWVRNVMSDAELSASSMKFTSAIDYQYLMAAHRRSR